MLKRALKEKLWLYLPVLVFGSTFYVLTLVYQSSSYWAGNYADAWATARWQWFLAVHPMAFVGGAIGELLIVLAVVLVLPTRIAKVFALWVALWQLFGVEDQLWGRINSTLFYVLLFVPSTLIPVALSRSVGHEDATEFSATKEEYGTGRRKSFFRAALIVIVLGLVAVGGFRVGLDCYNPLMQRQYRKGAEARQKKLVGKPAPDIAATTVSGMPWRLNEHKGKIVVLDFWATWCGPCVGSVPQMKELYSKYKDRDDFFLVGVSLDPDASNVVSFCQQKGIEWPQTIEPGAVWTNSVAKAFGVRGIPDICIINRAGNVEGVGYWVGHLEETIEKLLRPIK